MPARFQFRLQGLLEKRTAEAAEAARILHQSQMMSREAAGTLARAQDRAEGAWRLAGHWERYLREMEFQSRQTPGDWLHSLAQARRMLAGTAQAWHNRVTEMAAAERQVESCHRAVDAARILFEKRLNLQQRTEWLRDLEETKFLREQELEEMAELAEVARAMHYLNHALEEARPAQMETSNDGQA